ncbi:hypothetical protein CPAV1605_379 [seawater metagenome]|uniref:ATP-grasp domain-containing protein n=1 Tax=seawater metagenome TaxID=1561972 RepID=A0A5E8CJ17_9ZZZZ
MVKDYQSLWDLIQKYNLSEDIIINDVDAWEKYPVYRKIYNKLDLALEQNIAAGPIGIIPQNFPIVIKPIINLFGMSRGFKKINNITEYEENIKDGYFWMTYFPGKQYNFDFVILNGNIKTICAIYSKDNKDGSFNYHQFLQNYKISNKIKNWIKKNMKNYTGCLNMEVIDNNIIEAHLRLNGDFYGYDIDFVKELDKLFTKKEWTLSKSSYPLNPKILFPIFVSKDLNVKKLNFKTIVNLCKSYNIPSLRIDNIHSEYQQDNKARLFMFDIDDLDKGKELKNKILKIIS